MLTDGVFDAKNRDGQRIGFDAIVDLVQKHAREKQIIDFITGYVQTFSKGAERADDLTIVEITVS